ncbi:MAG: HIT domain-containing protein [Candidatus Latescibacteria bacterium]|nr:HIT domain-containing protein [Candidatus Latescibacterota bacterium]NIM20930.1 HIT domain-containing protein [Candidatus Latescibacterota bacterium]NIM65065.1 HIT domain-containing protein [Candidatus Latescibacterota bacterium]NIO01580.1 HIT domain-containing protein [Candidatus Latescibacterota bacterium]NIO28097.1 HIT domain-containing protein [Candidatus Latescibacterota bacterium]
MEDCIFCKIINGQIPSNKVYEDEDLLAFEDVNPVAPTHVVIIPKKHIETLNDIQEEDAGVLASLLLRAQSIATEKEIAEDGYRIVLNCMPGAGQSVYHIHFHLLGGRIFHWPPG